MKLSWTGIRNAIAPRSPIGIALGGLAFLASLTPSLIPRTPAMQGIIAAFAFMLAYAIGAGLARLYRWLGFTSPEGKTRSTADAILTGIALVAVAIGLVFAESWQNATQQALGINAESSWRSLIVILVALPLILIILLIARFFGRIARLIGTWLDRFIPERAAKLAGFTFAIFSHGRSATACWCATWCGSSTVPTASWTSSFRRTCLPPKNIRKRAVQNRSSLGMGSARPGVGTYCRHQTKRISRN